jgi:putative ABC transport system substrate-binding protein
MKRREFITLVGGGAAAWPLAAHAQQSERMRHIGVLLGLAKDADDPGADEILRPLRAAMQEAGWIEGKNIQLDYRFGGGDLAKISAAADELVALAPELIYASGLPSVQALRQRTRAIPIVFSLIADPIGFGLIEPQPPGRQHHRLCRLGSLDRWQMDAAAPRDRARSTAGRDHVQS